MPELMRRVGSSSRLPLRPRPLNADNGMRSSSVSSVGSASSKASSSTTNKYLQSYLSASGNENNQRVTSLTVSTLRKMTEATSDSVERDSSTVVNTGQRVPPFIDKEGRKKSGGSARSEKSERAAAAEPASAAAPRSKSPSPPAPTGRKASSSSSSRQRPKAAPDDNDEVVIEELRKNPKEEGHTVHKYLRGRLLGKGGFAKVYWCTSLDTNRHYAVKIVPKANLVKSRARQKLQAEIKIHRTLKHKNICEYKHFFEDRTNCYILLELCQNQSMAEMIKRRKRLTEPEVKYYMKQLLAAVRYMHGVNVIHRDLKLGNLFLDKHLYVKVGDLGLATKLSSADEKRKTICGTPNYIAPEVIDGNKEKRGHSFEVDIWSMGVICFTTLVGKPPYESKDVKSTYQRILNNQYEFPSHVPISGHARELITAMLQTNPQKRPTLDQIGSHPFLTHDEAKIPKSLPLSGTHVCPDWQEDSYGNIYAVEKDADEKYRRPTVSSRVKGKPLDDGAGVKVSSHRQPLSSRDANTVRGDVQQQAAKERTETAPLASKGKVVEKVSSNARHGSSQNFKIYDDNGGDQLAIRKSQHEKPPQSRPTDAVDEVTRKVSACAIKDERKIGSKLEDNGGSPLLLFDAAVVSSNQKSSACGKKEGALTSADHDMQALEAMHDRLRDAFNAAESGTARLDGNDLFAVSAGNVDGMAASKWVTRYVDYTSKYGLGFLLNDGSAGVYFNDSTKAVLAPKGETFMYVERRRVANMNEHAYETHTLSSYPETLQKKVTLLKHFRNYLVEQQKKAEENGEANVEVIDTHSDEVSSLVYLKKWVRTKHAILFRLSNRTVQVVFYDHTEVLLSSEAKVITYVDKKRQRATYSLDEIMMESSAEIGKRLKYAKDILHQLISGTSKH